MRKAKNREWRVTVGARRTTVTAKTPGAAVHRACRALRVRKPPTDHNTGGWIDVSWEVLPEAVA